MTHTEDGYFVLGTTTNGKKFRPSDWIDRLATTFASFDARRIQYHPQIHPADYAGQNSLFIAATLEQREPAVFAFIMNFAHNNQLQVTSTFETTDLYSSAA